MRKEMPLIGEEDRIQKYIDQANKKVDSQISIIKWFVGIGVAVMALLFAVQIFLLEQSPVSLEKDLDEIKEYVGRYDPLFRDVVLDKAYSILSDVHLTEIQFQPDIQKQVTEIKNSLLQMGAFENKNKGLLDILELCESLGKNPNYDYSGFLKTNPLTDSSLELNPHEKGFYLTFQAILLIKNHRKSPAESTMLLKVAHEKLLMAKKVNAGISNMWNALGIVYLEFFS